MAIGQVRLEYQDGTVVVVGTDGEWRVASGPIVFSNVYGGEDYDARLEPRGWDQPGFDDAGWSRAVVTEGSARALRGASHASPPFRTYETFAPVKVQELRPGVAVYDFGQNASMMPRLRVRGPAGATREADPVRAAEGRRLGGPDVVGRRGGLLELHARRAGRGRDVVSAVLLPRQPLSSGGARRARGSPLPDVESLESVVVHSDSPAAGEFASSSELFNRIRTLVHWAQRSNLAHVITDCPHRERLGWLEQYHLNGPSLRYETDLTRLYAQDLRGHGRRAAAERPRPRHRPRVRRLPGGLPRLAGVGERDRPRRLAALRLDGRRQRRCAGTTRR